MSGEQETATLAGCDLPAERAPSYGLARGESLGRYRVLRALGSGGMGLVYEAHDAELDRRVAIKLLREVHGVSEDRAALMREARALARLSHPNIVAVFDHGVVGGRPYIVVERIEGETLSHWLRRRDRSWRAVLSRLIQAGRGLAAVHHAGLVHGDVKPSNMVVDVSGRVRMVDLGLARSGRANGGHKAAEDGGLPGAGTPGFLAPEQISGAPADPRSDQFSFCCALWLGLYGRLPFGALANGKLGERVAAGKIDDGPHPRRVPRWLRHVLLRGLQALPRDRHADMDALLEALVRNPARRNRKLATAAIVLPAMVGAWSLSGRSIASPCTGAEEVLTAVWNRDHQRDLQQAIQTRAPRWAQASSARVVGTFDDYAQGWSAMHQEVCRATRVHGVQSERLMELRMACLDERLEEMKNTVRLLTTAETRLLIRAPAVAASLSRIEHCGDLASFRGLQVLPPEAPRRERLALARRQLAEVKSLQAVGRFKEAQPLVESALKAARSIGYRPTEARAALLLGVNRGRMGRWPDAESAFYSALEAAQAGHDDRTVATAWLDLVIIGWGTGRFDEADRAARLAEAAIDRLGGDLELEATLSHRRGMLANRQHRYEEALTHFEHARIGFETLYGNNSPRVGQTLNNAAIALRYLGRHADAATFYHRTIEIEKASFGQPTPSAAASLSNLSLLHLAMDDPAQAEKLARQSLVVYEQTLGADHPSLAGALVALGKTLLAKGDGESAGPVLERARTLRLEVAENDPSRLAEVEFLLARALASVGEEPRRAGQLAAQALERFRGAGPRAEADVAAVEAWIRGRG